MTARSTPPQQSLVGRRIFVTGGAGYIGSVCVEQLLDAGCEVTVFDNLSEGHRLAVDERAGFIFGDLRDDKAIRDAVVAHRPHAVMHFAASALVGESMRAPGKYFRNNVAAGINLLDALVEGGVTRLVYSSSCATYGLPGADLIAELADQVPINPYGESKLIFEQIARWYEVAHGLVSVGLRFFNVGGASPTRGEDHRIETHLIPSVLQVALGQRGAVEIHGTDYPTPNGTCVRDFIHVLDIAAAHIAVLGATEGGCFNLGNGAGYSVAEVLSCCRRVTGHIIPTMNSPRRAGDPSRLVADARKIESMFGWRPRHSSLEEIVTSAWNWHRNHPTGYGDGAALRVSACP